MIRHCRVFLPAGTVLWEGANAWPHRSQHSIWAIIKSYDKGSPILVVKVDDKDYEVKVVEVMGCTCDLKLHRPNKDYWWRKRNLSS